MVSLIVHVYVCIRETAYAIRAYTSISTPAPLRLYVCVCVYLYVCVCACVLRPGALCCAKYDRPCGSAEHGGLLHLERHEWTRSLDQPVRSVAITSYGNP